MEPPPPTAPSPRVAIIGAGPAGLAAAYELAKAGIGAHVFEASAQVGGLCRSIELWGQHVDLGPHRFFSQERAVNALWLEVVGKAYDMVPRLTRIHYRGRFFDYPLRIGNALRQLGPREIVRCGIDYARAQLRGRGGREETFEDWVSARFGRRLYEIFFKAYSEKLWGIPCSELSADFAAQRIKQLDLRAVLRAALVGDRDKKHRTLVDVFAYPHGGTGTVYERMAAQAVERGATLHLEAPVASVLVEGGRVRGVKLRSGEVHACDVVLSSMPLTLLVKGLADVPAPVLEAAQSLTFRNTVLVYLEVEGACFPDNWVYVHSPALAVGRITNFENWSAMPSERGKSILCLELWANVDDPLWREPDDRLAAIAERELKATGLVDDARVLGRHVIKIPRSYPVYRMGYERHVEVIRRHLDGIAGLYALGRYGAFKYNNQDHSLLMGIRAAAAIAAGQVPDLWSINSDDAYQEGAVITATGLQPLGAA